MSNSDDSLPPSGQMLQRAFELLIGTLEERQVRYAIIGGLAILQHTRTRTTNDIDALLTVPQLNLPGFLEALRERGFTVDVVKSIREFRDGGLTTLKYGDVLVDLMKPILPVYDRVLDSAISAEIYGKKVRVSSAEGLIIMKLIAMRPIDESDIQDLLAVYAGQLDLEFIRRELQAITNDDDPRRAKLESWIQHPS